MPWNAHNGTVRTAAMEMEYVSFGSGRRQLILLPGLSDGLATVKGKALLLAPPYQLFFNEYTVYMFSRRNDLKRGTSIEDMADDQAEALKALGIDQCDVLGVSQGGMIALALAVRHPEIIHAMVCAVTAPYANETVCERVGNWIGLAEKEDHKALMIDTAENSYSQKKLKSYRLAYPLLGHTGRPKSYERFFADSEAILRFDIRQQLSNIRCPVLVIGGSDDRIVGTKAAYELAENIPGAKLYIYEGLGHGAYEEAKDFNRRVCEFLRTCY